jgi:hypothetical protein
MAIYTNRIELPMPDWAKKHGYIKWHKVDDVIIYDIFGDSATINLRIRDKETKIRVIERKYRRIGLPYSVTRSLSKKISTVILNKTKGNVIEVDFK